MNRSVIVPNFDKNGLITVVAQEQCTGKILMVAHTDRTGFFETLTTSNAVYFSRSRNRRWIKGESSGNTQSVQDIKIDCDGDTVIYAVTQNGNGACHMGKYSCFYRSIIGSMFEPAAGKFDVEFIEVHPNFL